MLRTVRYGFSAAILAGVVGGMVAWSHVDKTVSLVVDGQSTQIQTSAATVGDVLAGAGYRVGAHDLLAPASTTSVHNGSEIVLRRGRMLVLTVDGETTDVWTTAPTVADALAQLGYSTADFTSVSRARRLPLTPTDIALRTPKLVTIKHDGQVQEVTTTDATVEQVLSDLSITVGPQDKLTPAGATAVSDDELVILQRITNGQVVRTMSVPYATTTQRDPTQLTGTTQLVNAGKNGEAQVTYAVVYVDGKVVGETKIKTVLVVAPVNRVRKIGTKAAPPSTSTSVVSAGSSTPAIVTSPDAAHQIARTLLLQRGWGQDQMNCLGPLWNHESGWRVTAGNSSGAYGIPQALPGSKMASYGADWRTDAKTQIEWGLAYIASRYGTPCGAWSSWQANGGWY